MNYLDSDVSDFAPCIILGAVNNALRIKTLVNTGLHGAKNRTAALGDRVQLKFQLTPSAKIGGFNCN